MSYWRESIEQILEDAGVSVTNSQMDMIVEGVEGSHECYSQATGLDVADGNFVSDDARELARIRKDITIHEDYINSTEPCPSCITTGVVRDGYGRDVQCECCYGHGRIKKT
jgi:hypothetical protein